MTQVNMLDIRLRVDWERQEVCITDGPTIELVWSLSLGPYLVKGVRRMATVTMTDVQKVGASIVALDAKGNAAALDGAPTWTASDPAGLSLTVAVDGLSAEIAAVGPLGVFQVTVRADARVGPDVVEIVGLLDVEIVASEAVTINVVPGTPQDQ